MTKQTDTERRREQQRAEMKRYEADNDLVPGTSSHDGKTARGGVEWEGLARMALGRHPDDRTADDVEALRRYPTPRSSMTGEPLDELQHAERRGAVVTRVEPDGYVARERNDVD